MDDLFRGQRNMRVIYLLRTFRSCQLARNAHNIRTVAAFNFTATMETDLSRHELEARLETIESKMEGRVARIEDSVQRIESLAVEIKADHREIRQSVSGLKATLIVTAIGAVLTVVLGVAAFNATLQANMLSAFQVGLTVSQP